jgi:hypothetical protein
VFVLTCSKNTLPSVWCRSLDSNVKQAISQHVSCSSVSQRDRPFLTRPSSCLNSSVDNRGDGKLRSKGCWKNEGFPGIAKFCRADCTLLCGYYNWHSVSWNERDDAINITMSSNSYQHPLKKYFSVKVIYEPLLFSHIYSTYEKLMWS